MSQKNNSGFTLVEISIVMIIIGLLIGGTFGGLAMIENMKASSAVQEINKFQAVTINFKETYGAYPGDIFNPAEVLPNCVSPCDNGGNRDGRIGNYYHGWDADYGWNAEQVAYWQHLTAANMIEGTVVGGGSGGRVFGVHIPLSPFDTGYRIFHDGITSVANSKHGMAITNVAIGSGNLGGTTPEDLVIPGSAARNMDTKMDDSNPNTGNFLSWTSVATTEYDASLSYGSRYLYNF